MTIEEAVRVVQFVDDNEEACGRFNNLADLGSKYWIARGFMEGWNAALEKAAENCKQQNEVAKGFNESCFCEKGILKLKQGGEGR